MSRRARKKQPDEVEKPSATRPKLRSIAGGKPTEHREESPLEELLSGRVPADTEKPKRRRKGEVPPQELPGDVQIVANIFAAGRTIDKEVSFKVNYAKQRIEDFCLRDWVHRFALTNRRPAAVEYKGDHSRFKFVMTSRTTLTSEKAERLKSLGIRLDEHTQLRDVEINYDAIKQHGLEDKLKQALGSLGVAKGVIEECFRPRVELKAAFYDVFAEVVRRSLGSGEDLEEKMFEVLTVLDPAEQIRNTEAVGMDLEECFDYIVKAEIEAEEEIA